MTSVLLGTRREAMPLDLMRQSTGESAIEDALKGLFAEDQVQAFLTPPDTMAEFVYGLSRTAQGREFFEWLLDCTLRAPYQVTGNTIEETALNAARREGFNASAELILATISRGEKTVMARASGAKQ